MKRVFRYIILPILIFLFCFYFVTFLSGIFTDWDAYAMDRCQEYVVDARTQHQKYFGLDYPYWYGVAQLKQESQCRETAHASFDGGMGIAQFMPATWKDINQSLGGKLNPYVGSDAIRAQAYFMSQVHKLNFSGSKKGHLWLTYQAYNGWWTLLKKEYQRAGILDWKAMRAKCKRKIVTTPKYTVDFCNVNYSYSKQVFSYAQRYKFSSDKWGYWGDK